QLRGVQLRAKAELLDERRHAVVTVAVPCQALGLAAGAVDVQQPGARDAPRLANEVPAPAASLASAPRAEGGDELSRIVVERALRPEPLAREVVCVASSGARSSGGEQRPSAILVERHPPILLGRFVRSVEDVRLAGV